MTLFFIVKKYVGTFLKNFYIFLQYHNPGSGTFSDGMFSDGDGTFFILHIVCNLVYLGGVQTPGGEVSG